MTLVMGLNRSIYPFTPERPRDLSALTPEPAPSGVYELNRAAQITLFEKLRKTKCQLRVHPLRYQVKEFCVLFSLLTGLEVIRVLYPSLAQGAEKFVDST